MPFRTHYTTRHGLKAKLTATLILYLNAYLLHEYRFNIGVSGDRETSRLRVLQVAVNGIHVSSCLFSSDIPSLPPFSSLLPSLSLYLSIYPRLVHSRYRVRLISEEISETSCSLTFTPLRNSSDSSAKLTGPRRE